MHERRVKLGYCVLLLFFILLTVTSLTVGNYNDLSGSDVFQVLLGRLTGKKLTISNTAAAIVWNIRIPRTVSAILIGAALSTAGCCYQEIFQNDLASPDILGVSSGACVGAALGIIQGVSSTTIQLWAFSTGLVTVAMVYLLSSVFRGEKRVSLPISGILISGFMNSILGLIKYLANPETQLPSIVYWTMGDISTIHAEQLKSVMAPIVGCMLLLLALRWRLNYFSVAETVSVSMGIDIIKLRILCIVLSTILVGCAVSVAGTISWIGLVIPHLIKTLFGKNAAYTLPLSCLAGSEFLLFVDIIGRKISTSEIPLSILTGIIGLVVFFGCLFFRRAGQNDTGV